jgi:hypothetical protein
MSKESRGAINAMEKVDATVGIAKAIRESG